MVLVLTCWAGRKAPQSHRCDSDWLSRSKDKRRDGACPDVMAFFKRKNGWIWILNPAAIWVICLRAPVGKQDAAAKWCDTMRLVNKHVQRDISDTV